ncbi:MAG: hypothetical protein KDK36_15300 [Leptospiraceae bacterium]|nr:hypothetical protein [Leptospiraceae bacterium]
MNNPIEFQKIKHEIDSYQNKYISNIYNGIETKSNEELISDIESIHLEDADLIENLTKEWVLKS